MGMYEIKIHKINNYMSIDMVKQVFKWWDSRMFQATHATYHVTNTTNVIGLFLRCVRKAGNGA